MTFTSTFNTSNDFLPPPLSVDKVTFSTCSPYFYLFKFKIICERSERMKLKMFSVCAINTSQVRGSWKGVGSCCAINTSQVRGSWKGVGVVLQHKHIIGPWQLEGGGGRVECDLSPGYASVVNEISRLLEEPIDMLAITCCINQILNSLVLQKNKS